MAFDMIPDTIDFDIAYEPTKVDGKKYVINTNTGEYIAVVGDTFGAVSHKEFYKDVIDTVTEELGFDDLSGAEYKWRSARNGGFAMLDLRLPSMTTVVRTDKHETEIGNRIIALHGIDGLCSNQVFFGAIDFFCTNGMIRGDYDKVRRKNTANFSMEAFIYELTRARKDFYEQAQQLQVWAQTDLKYVDIATLLDEMVGSKRKAERMYSLYMEEARVRGHNKFALYSAFTNYASYADDRNGFKLRASDNDTEAVTMWNREQEVSKWISDPKFIELEAA